MWQLDQSSRIKCFSFFESLWSTVEPRYFELGYFKFLDITVSTIWTSLARRCFSFVFTYSKPLEGRGLIYSELCKDQVLKILHAVAYLFVICKWRQKLAARWSFSFLCFLATRLEHKGSDRQTKWSNTEQWLSPRANGYQGRSYVKHVRANPRFAGLFIANTDAEYLIPLYDGDM